MSNTINLNNGNIPTIHQFRRAGWKVRVIHIKKEITTIQITCPNNINGEGNARCSVNDNWNRKLGNRIALGRAVKNYLENKNPKPIKNK